jgi:hypothetical protein
MYEALFAVATAVCATLATRGKDATDLRQVQQVHSKQQ